MAREERKKEDLFIKKKRRASNFFVTSSAKMDEKEGVNKTTISSSVFTEMKSQFDAGEYLTDNHFRETNGAVLYMLQEMQQDIDDVYNEVSASSFEASFFPFATMDSASFGIVSSSLIPDADNTHNLGSSGKEWNDLYVDGTAYIDAINYQGTALAPTITELNYVDGVSSAIQTQLDAKLPKAGGTITGVVNEALIRFTDRDATPSVKAGNKFEVRYSRATNITMFDNPSAGQEITLIITDSPITFVYNTRNIFLQRARNATLAAGDTITFISNGLVWYEKCRSDNT